jgi:DNA-directed RNA polymerase subunit F
MLVDGYHRFLEAVIIGVKSVRIKNDDNLARLYRVFDRTEAWDYDLFKLIEPEELQKLKEELLNKSSMKKHLEKHE